jgi:hypothetical protein
MSIKNKFATAVATASLLAGLFGSAFVPSALGAVVTPADAVVPKYTTLTAGGEVNQAGTSKVFGFQTEDSNINGEDDLAWIAVELFKTGAAGAGTVIYDFEAAENDEVLLTATSSNSAVQVGFGYDSVDSTVEACSGANMVFGTSATVYDVDGTDEGPGIVDSAYKICLRSKTATTAATSTVTVTVGSVVATTFTVTAVGPVASLTASITDGYKYVAEDNAAIDEWFTIIAKDAAGVQINGATTSISAETVTVSDWADQVENVQESQIVALGANIGTIGTGTADIGYELEASACSEESGSGEGDGDAGSSYALKFEHTTAGLVDVVSNAVTITCTLNSDGARVTAVTPEATTNTGSPNANGGLTYNETAAGSDDDLYLLATVVDEDGISLGDGADCVDFDWDFEGDADLDWTNNGCDVAVGGEYLLGMLEPITTRFGRFTYTVTAADSDLSTDVGEEVEKAFTKTFTAVNSASAATITKVRNAAKTTAIFTADMGEDAAFDVVSFTVELKNGTVVVYDRRANANGVAKLTLSKRRTTIYVYASYNSDTNVMKSVFR